MAKYGAPSPKSQLGWSNDEAFIRKIVARGGYLSQAEKSQMVKVELAKRGVNMAGKATYTGVKKTLKQSQYLELVVGLLVELFVGGLCRVGICFLCSHVIPGVIRPNLGKRFWRSSAMEVMLLGRKCYVTRCCSLGGHQLSCLFLRVVTCRAPKTLLWWTGANLTTSSFANASLTYVKKCLKMLLALELCC